MLRFSFLYLLQLSVRMPVWLQVTGVSGPCSESTSAPVCMVGKNRCGMMLLILTQVGYFFITGAACLLFPLKVKHCCGFGPILFACENALFILKLRRNSQGCKLFSLLIRDFFISMLNLILAFNSQIIRG